MRILKIILVAIIFCFLTLLTQIGGLIYLLSFLSHQPIEKWTINKYSRRFLKFSFFIILYLISTFFIVPLIAKPLGRVPLSFTETNHLKPLTIWTCLLNRNYVNPVLKQVAYDISTEMNVKFPGTTLNYLDANFPFINKFPLLPHLSHNDGKKLDLSFCYLDAKTGNQTNGCPSFIGYGISEEASEGERNTAGFCAEKGYWQYGLLNKIIPQGNKHNFTFDAARIKALIRLFIKEEEISKVFIEPHLKTRLNLESDKIRFHGCQAVRHDDHIHIQIK